MGDRVQGLDAGADDYLVNPFTFKESKVRDAKVMPDGTMLEDD